MALFASLFVLMAMVVPLFGPPSEDQLFPEMLVACFVLPFVYAVFGWLSGFLAATAFNLIGRYTGGLKVEIVQNEAQVGPTHSGYSVESSGCDHQ